MNNGKKIAALLFTALLFGGTENVNAAAHPAVPAIGVGLRVDLNNVPRYADSGQPVLLTAAQLDLFKALQESDAFLLTNDKLSPAGVTGLAKYLQHLIDSGLTGPVIRAWPIEDRAMNVIDNLIRVSRNYHDEKAEKFVLARTAIGLTTTCVDGYCNAMDNIVQAADAQDLNLNQLIDTFDREMQAVQDLVLPAINNPNDPAHPGMIQIAAAVAGNKAAGNDTSRAVENSAQAVRRLIHSVPSLFAIFIRRAMQDATKDKDAIMTAFHNVFVRYCKTGLAFGIFSTREGVAHPIDNWYEGFSREYAEWRARNGNIAMPQNNTQSPSYRFVNNPDGSYQVQQIH